MEGQAVQALLDWLARMGEDAMAFQPVPDTVEVTLVFTQNLENLTNSFHAELAGGYVLADLITLAAAVDTLVVSEILPIISQDCLYVRTEVRGLAVPNDLFVENGAGTGTGGVLTEGLPNNVTLSLKKISGFTGRSARGRWYAIGMSVNHLDTNENQIIQARVDDWVAALEGLRGGIVAGAFTPVIVSRFTAGAQRPTGVTFDWLGTVAVNRNVDSQRGRLTR